MARYLIALIAFVMLGGVTSFGRADITVCASGCDFKGVQAAIDAAVDGDVIKLAAGETFVGNFILRNKGALATGITIRSDALDANLPAVGVRAGAGRTVTRADGTSYTTPDHRAFMPNIRAASGGLPAFRTEASADGYTLLGLEFESNPGGFNVIVEFGVNTVAQRLRSEQPTDMTVDRCLFLGSPIHGQKVGVDMNGANITVKNSWFEYINADGQDSVVVRSVNGSGPFLIENNHLQGGTETSIIGGGDPWMMTSADVSAGATTTTATLTSFADRAGSAFGDISTLRVGQTIAFLYGGATPRRHHTTVRSCGTSTPGATCTSAAITFDAIPSAPDTGAGALSDARWGSVPDGVTYRRNWFGHLPSEYDPIIGQVGAVTATAFTTGGTMTAATRYYKVVAYSNAGYNNNNAYGTASAEVSCTTTGTTGRCDLSWPAVANATHYRVYLGTAAGAQTGYLLATGTTSLSDTGGALTTASLPSPSRWDIKTLFELKFGINVLFEHNVMENIRGGFGDAYGQCFWLKSNNQEDTSEWVETTNVIVQHNICHTANGVFNLLGQGGVGTAQGGEGSPRPMRNLSIKHNLFYNNTTAYGPSVDAIRVNGAIPNLDIDHNTFITHARGLLYFTNSNAALTTEPGFRFTNNLTRATPYSFFGISCSNGTSCLNKHAPGHVVEGNVLAGASASANPGNNLFSSLTEFEAQFQDYDGGINGNYALVDGSPYLSSATDGTNRGANISTVLSGVTGVIEGVPSGSANPPSITTTGALTPCTIGVAYTFTLQSLGGTGAITWTQPSGSLPAGLTRSGAVISGTCTTAGTSTFTVVATDTASLTDTESVSIAAVAAPAALNITTGTPLPGGTVPLSYSQQIAVTGGTDPYTCAVTSGTLPGGLTLSTDCLLSGVPTTGGANSFTVTATDAVGATDAQAYSLTVTPEQTALSACTQPRRTSVTIGGIVIQSGSFVGPVAPPSSCVRVGDDWEDTSTSPPTTKEAIAGSPAPVWVVKATSGGTAAHNILSTLHSDATVDTLAEGDMLVAVLGSGDVVRLARLPVGAAGTSLSSTGTGVAWLPQDISGAPAVQTHTMYAGAALVMTDVPAAGSEFGSLGGGRYRMKLDVENSTQIAITAYFTGACSTSPVALLRIDYWDGSAWQPTGASTACTTGLKEGAFVSLAAGARSQDRVFRAFYTDGDGAADPSLTTLQLRFR